MPVLIDVNVLLALVSERDTRHHRVLNWFAIQPEQSVLVCRVAQLGFLRLLNNPSVMGAEAIHASGCLTVWNELLHDGRICFASTEPNGLDATFSVLIAGQSYTPKLWTDAYLAAFAVADGYRLATLDTGFARYPGLELELIG